MITAHISLRAKLLAFGATTLAALALAGATASFKAMAGEAAPLPGFGDVWNKTPIVGIEPGTSFVRFANLRDEGAVTNYVEIFGLDDRKTLGSFQVEVPAKASVQIDPARMIQTFAAVNWDQPIVLYVENGREKQLWQHVRYNARSGEFTNASVCTFAPHADYIPPTQVAINVHTNRIGRYVSMVTAHNFTDTAGVFEARLYDASTGKSMGKVDIALEARESFCESGLWFQDAAELSATQEIPGHMNIEFVPKAPDTGARLVVGHAVYDFTTGQGPNLSNPCSIHGGIITLPPEGQPQ